VRRYQKGKTNLDFTEARVSGRGTSWAICKSAPYSRQKTTPAPHHYVFYRLDAPPAAQPTASKHWRQTIRGTHYSKCPSPLIIRRPVYQIYTTVCSASDVSWQRGTARICCCGVAAAERRAANNRYLLLTGPTIAEWGGRMGQTDGRTPYHCIDLALRAKHAVPIWYEIRTAVVFNNQLQVVMH